MVTTFKKPLSVLLSLVLTAFLLPLPASADPVTPEEAQDGLLAQEEAAPVVEDEAAEEGSDEGAEDSEPDTSWHIAGTARWKIENGTLTIAPLEGETSGEFTATIVLDSDRPWHERYEEIKTAEILETVTLPNKYCRLFRGCSSLQNIDLSGLDTSNMTDMSSFFYECSSLERIDLSRIDTSNVTRMVGMFDGCRKLSTLDLTSFCTSKVTDMARIFRFCNSLESVNLSSFDTSSVTNVADMFRGCSKLDQLDLSSFDTRHLSDEAIEAANKMFGGCAAEIITVGECFTLQKWFRQVRWYNAEGDSFAPAQIPAGRADTYSAGLELKTSTIKPPVASIVDVGAQVQLEVEVSPQPTGALISWDSSDSSVGTVDTETGLFTAVSPGTTEIIATSKYVYRSGNYITQERSITIEVRKCVRSVSMTEASKVVYVNDGPFTLQASVDPPDAYNAALGWQSSNTAVATVDANGQVTPLSVGETTITATAGGFSDTCIVVVEDEPIIPVTSVFVDPSALTLTGQESKRLSVTVGPADATNKDVEWFSSNTAVAAVDAEGNVSAQGKGTATITAASLDGGVKATCAVTVLNPPTTATLGATPHEVRVSKSESVAITLGGALPGATEALDSAAWESSDTSVLSVSGNGLSATVTGVGVGAATIAFNGTYDGADLSASFDVDVIWDDVTSITLSETEKVLMMGSEPVELRYSIQPLSAQGAELVWKSSAAGVASVDQSGRVTPVSPGQATITVTAKGTSAQCEVTVIEKPEDVVDVASIALDRASLELTGAQSVKLTATVAPENATYKTVHWTSSDLSVAKVDATGLVTSVRKGTATITASSADGAKKATCVVTVLNPLTSISLSPASKTVSVGESFNVGLTPKGDLPGDVDSVGEVTWSSSDEAVAKVTPNAMMAKVDALSAGVAEVTAATSGAEGAITASATIHVTWPAPVALTLDRHELSLDVSSVPVQLSASASPAEALNAGVRWTSTDPKVVSVDETGLVRPVRAGTATVSVTLGNLKDECAITVGAVRLDAAPDSEVPGYVLVQDPATAELLRGLHVVINRNDAKEDSRLAPLLVEDQDEGMTVAESYDIHLVDDAGNRVAWNSPQSPLTVCMQMDEALLSLSEANRLGIHYVDDGFTTVEAKATQVRDGYLTFETTHFSTYALTATPYPDGTGSGDGDDGSGSGDGSGDGAGSGGSADGGSGPSRASGDVGSLPQTGDDLNLIALWILLGALLAATAACRFLAERRS